MAKRANNEGSINKRNDGRWEGKIIVGIKSDGKPDRKSVYGKTQKEVKEKLEALKSHLRLGTYAAPSSITVKQWLSIWVNDYAQVATRTSTYKKYFSLIKSHIIPAIGNIRLQDLKTNVIQNLFATLLKSGNLRTKKGLSPSTVAEIHLILNQACAQAIANNLINKNPVTATKKPSRNHHEINPYTKEELDLFLDAAKDHRLYPAFLLEAHTGLRRSELLGLKWKDLDFIKGTVTIVRANKVDTKSDMQTKTKSGNRTIVIAKKTLPVLAEHKRQQDMLQKQLGDAYINEEFIFCQQNGKRSCPRSFSRSFNQLLRKRQLRKIRFHDLRHTHATLLLAKGIPVDLVSKQLGHASIRITLENYSHILPGMQEQIAELLDNIL